MLRKLHLKGVGPAHEFGPIHFAGRLNFFTGDNGLGKSFLLDTAWWALTRTWARDVPAFPQHDCKVPTIAYAFDKSSAGQFQDESTFNRSGQLWSVKQGRPPIPGVVIYAGADGNFSVWDPARNYWQDKDPDAATKPKVFHFSAEQVWRGLPPVGGVTHCNGLIRDWVSWQDRRNAAFENLQQVLTVLSPSEAETLTPGEPVRIGNDVTEYPSLRMPYGQDVPLIHASAGMRRIAALAYLLVWAWREHVIASENRGLKVASEIIFLIDEIECHLHPQWQRRIVPALLRVMSALTEQKVRVQLIVATHSPLVLASAEPDFDETQDAVFNIRLVEKQAVIGQETWAKQGDVVNWLVSDVFGLQQARSVEAERAISAADAWMLGQRTGLPEGLATQDAIHAELVRVLPGGDHFWPRWVVWVENQSGVAP